jgi:hypothetical protein
MIPAFFKRLAAILAIVAVLAPCAARATMMADPATLYQEMKDAYAKGAANGWGYHDQLLYLSTIFNAGRAYSLQYPDDPAYGELATLTVQIGSGLHYNPLTNHDATVWWVREACDWVTKHSNDPALVGQAATMLQRVSSEDDAEQLAAFADADATANLQNYPRDVDALLAAVEANWRGWILTHNPAWRWAQPEFPIVHLPTTYGPEFVNAVQSAASGGAGFTADDVANAQIVLARLKAVAPLRVITSVTAMPHAAYLTTLAPADEYFGRLGMSILGIENQLKHINFMLDYNYGDRETSELALVCESVDDMHKVYPRDRDLPMLLYWCYSTFARIDSSTARAAQAHMRGILTVEYQDSPEARNLLNGTPAKPAA